MTQNPGRSADVSASRRVLSFDCPGITTPQPPDAPGEGFVACWRAGHECPPKLALVEVERGCRTTTYRCPCCGDHGVTFCEPVAWLS